MIRAFLGIVILEVSHVAEKVIHLNEAQRRSKPFPRAELLRPIYHQVVLRNSYEKVKKIKEQIFTFNYNLYFLLFQKFSYLFLNYSRGFGFLLYTYL